MPWDAPESFFRWACASETADFARVLQAPLSRDNWLAAQWLFRFPGFRNRHTALQTQMLKAMLERMK